MEIDSVIENSLQPMLFETGEISPETIELFPAVWNAAEVLTYPDSAARRAALNRLEDMGAARFSPLVSYIVATRLTDPDIDLRNRVVRLIGNLLASRKPEVMATEMVRQHLLNFLSQMRTRQVFSLLQAVEYDHTTERQVAAILNGCPFASNNLINILSDRKTSLGLRILAVKFLGVVGYCDAIQALERLEARLETRLSGQQMMPFAPAVRESELELLPHIRATLSLLKAV